MGNVLSIRTIGGYLAVSCILGGYWYYANSTSTRGVRRGLPLKPVAKQIDSRKETKEAPKARKAKKEIGHIAGEDTPSEKSKKRKPAPQVVQSENKIEPSSYSSKDNDKENDAEFARQLSSLKTGSILPAQSQAGSRQKSVKQTRAQEKSSVVETSSDNATAPSSAAGGDADDDQSPISSPEVNATVNKDDPVADMLQPESSGASVLRITESNTPARAKKENRPAKYEAVETKKQRQNRKKAEQKKQLLQESEQERKVLMEKQRRTAREAEGRAAKDGSTFMASKAPTSSAWSAGPATSNGPANSTPKPVELLDTYESSKGASVPTQPKTSGSPEKAGNLNDLSPEEKRQVELAIQDSTWEEVKKKPRKAKKAATEDEASDKEKSVRQTDFGVPPVIKPTGPGQKWNMTLVSVEDGKAKEYEKEVQDSEWEVA